MAHLWIRLDSRNPLTIKKSCRDLVGRVINLVQETQTSICIEVPEGEQGWVDKISRDFNLNQTILIEPVQYEKAPCGILTTSVKKHHIACTKCKIAEGRPLNPQGPKPTSSSLRPSRSKNGKVKTVLGLPGLSDFTLNGFLSLLKSRQEETMDLAEVYEQAIKALEGLEKVENLLTQLQGEKKQHIQALNFFLEEKRKSS